MFHNKSFVHYVMLASLHFVNSQLWQSETDNTCPKDFNDIWDKTTTPASQLIANFCSQTCHLPNKTISSNYTCLSACCYPCDCNRPRCEIYGTCCPDVLKDQQKQISPTTGVERKKIKCTGLVNEHYLFISSCPQNYSNDIVRNLCETKNFDSSKIVETNTRVSDSKTGVAYFNKYCALCNNVTDFESWNISITCHHYLNVYKAITEFELLELSQQEYSYCNLKDIPVNSHFVTCKTSWYQKPIDSCNVTGKWLKYDPDVEYNCLYNFNSFHRIISVGSTTYKNIFCALCNLKGPPRNGCYLNDDTNFSVLAPFSFLLNIRNKIISNLNLETRFLDCRLGSRTNCKQIQCSDGKIFSKGQCVTQLSRIRGLGYKLQLVYKYKSLKVFNKKSFTPEILDHVLSSLKDWINDILTDWALETNMEISFSCARSFKKIMDNFLNVSGQYKLSPTVTLLTVLTEVLTMSLYYFNVQFIAKTSRGRDELENSFVQFLFQEEIEIEVSGNSLGLKYVSGDISDDVEAMEFCADMKLCHTTGEIQLPSRSNYQSVWESKDKFLRLTPILTCAHVSFNKSDFIVETVDTDIHWIKQITLSLGEMILKFKIHKELVQMIVIDNNILKVCVDLLLNKIDEVKNDLFKNTMVLYQYILTLLCLSVSIICLTFTLVVYLTFSILRNIPGLHNMFLSATLLLSQALLLASAQVKGPSSFCTFLGILTHLLWLSMFCWSFLCCFHMYSVFMANSKSQISSFKKRVFYWKVFLTILVPVSIVGCVVLYDFLSSGGQSFGYGLSSCYLNSPELIIYSLGIPMAFVLACNMFFFLSSVHKINEIKQLQSIFNIKKKERKQMFIYVKLSTMTGVFWSVAILSEALDNDPLRFIAIVLNGLQGLFIFVSYICNRRVLTLCQHWLGQFKIHTTMDTFTTDQGSSTLNRF